jgi:hypothetical protein
MSIEAKRTGACSAKRAAVHIGSPAGTDATISVPGEVTADVAGSGMLATTGGKIMSCGKSTCRRETPMYPSMTTVVTATVAANLLDRPV